MGTFKPSELAACFGWGQWSGLCRAFHGHRRSGRQLQRHGKSHGAAQ